MKEQATESPGKPSLTILIADDHWVVRESLKQVAKSLDGGFNTIEAESFHDAVQALESRPDIGLVLVDLIMPGFNEFDGLKLLRSKFPATPVVVVSIHDDPNYVVRAISHGVVGYIPKTANAEEIKTALVRVVSGEVAFPREILSQVTSDELPGASGERGHKAATTIEVLTQREREILVCLGSGLSLPEISSQLDISRQTVRVHLGNAMKKMNIATRETLIRFSIENLAALKAD